MINKNGSHFKSALLAVFVTFLWSTSWVLIKIGLKNIPAITFAGLRYTIAFVCLVPVFVFSKNFKGEIGKINLNDFFKIFLLGILFYFITQGSQFLGLFYLPSVTVTLMLNFTTIIVAAIGILFLGEKPSLVQWIGIILFTIGAVIYFIPVSFPQSEWIGLLIVLIGVFANALSSVLGRSLNRKGNLRPLTITVLSMGVGAILLLITGISLQGFPALGLNSWLIIIWLAIINTAIAFTIWNHTLRTLTAAESSIINNTMLIQIAILAWIFLGETLDTKEIVGLIFAACGAFAVQIKRK
ncbi:MAG: DMT family transporter [Ignavibacteriales bacterium]|nr:DMT family transporter [Ignavibacteriales bacterium]